MQKSPDKPKAIFGLTNLSDGYENPIHGFDLGLTLAAYWYLQKHKSNRSHDALLHDLDKNIHSQNIILTLLIDLARVDPIFHALSCRMGASSLLKTNGTVGKFVGGLIANLLMIPPPETGKSTLGRDVGLTIAINFGTRSNINPTETLSKSDTIFRNSGCQKISNDLNEKFDISMDYSAIERIWKRRKRILLNAGFSEKDISDFLSKKNPMSEY